MLRNSPQQSIKPSWRELHVDGFGESSCMKDGHEICDWSSSRSPTNWVCKRDWIGSCSHATLALGMKGIMYVSRERYMQVSTRFRSWSADPHGGLQTADCRLKDGYRKRGRRTRIGSAILVFIWTCKIYWGMQMSDNPSQRQIVQRYSITLLYNFVNTTSVLIILEDFEIVFSLALIFFFSSINILLSWSDKF